MSRVLGFVILHTGRPYFAAAIESIYDQVDYIVVLYTDRPSQGFGTDMPCPDTREELMECAEPFMDKILWVDGRWDNEGAHTSAIFQFTNGFDWLWRFDADEISPPGMVAEMIRQAEETQHKTYCVPFVHFWRSLSKCCHDGQMPVRLARVNGGDGQRYLDSKDGKWFVYHGGYAQPNKYLIYKQLVSGHRPEFRPDWYEEKWLKNAQEDVHPVCFPGHWNAQDFDKTKMPEVLKKHPFYEMDLIE